MIHFEQLDAIAFPEHLAGLPTVVFLRFDEMLLFRARLPLFATTVLGMIPLVTDPFFSSMAVTIMFGLSFAAVFSLLVTPVLYAIFYRIRGEA